jgi:hypothetical protein
MKKIHLIVLIFFLTINVVFSQSNTSPVPQMDEAISALAGELHDKLVEIKVDRIALGQFSFQDSITPFSSYWVNHLTGELTNISGRPYSILSGGQADAPFTLSGEFVRVADIIRVYTRLIRTADRTIEASFYTNFERNEHTNAMLVSESGGSGERSSSVVRDAHETDSFENPVLYEIGVDESVTVMSRTIHSNSDEDFFLLIPASDGRLIMETTGSIDTMMDFYLADSRELLESNDDGGSSYNARIRYEVQAGTRYIAKVKGYGSTTGSYAFRAYLNVRVQAAPDEFEPDNESSAAGLIEIGTSQQHNFHNSNDVDWVKFQVTQPGRYTIRARGVNSNSLDTYIELFNTNLNSIAEDDDGGESYSSRLSLHLDVGLYYLKVWCLGDEPDQPYTVSVTAD